MPSAYSIDKPVPKTRLASMLDIILYGKNIKILNHMFIPPTKKKNQQTPNSIKWHQALTQLLTLE